MDFSVRFYYFDTAGERQERPVLTFLTSLQKANPVLHKLLVAGIKKIEKSERHGPPLTEMVDKDNDILEIRVGDTNIARAFFFFRKGQEIIVTNGYVKKQQKVDAGALVLARQYKRDWEERFP